MSALKNVVISDFPLAMEREPVLGVAYELVWRERIVLISSKNGNGGQHDRK